MSARRSASFCLMIHFLLRSSEAQENITAVVGQEVTLPCKVNNNNNNKPIIAVEWNRPELEPEYVLFFRDGRLDPDNQLPFYVNRVNLQDREMKDGDISMKLMNVTKNDTGTYECRVSQRETNRRKRSTLSSDPINIIYLVVGPSGDKDGGDKDGGDKAVGDKDGGDKDGGDKDGGNKDGGDKDGGDKDGGNKVGGDKVGGDKDGGEQAEGHKAGGDKDGGNNVGIILGVVGLILLLAVASVGFLVYRRHKRQKSNLPVPPGSAADQLLV